MKKTLWLTVLFSVMPTPAIAQQSVFIADNSANEIYRANIDGTGKTVLFSTGGVISTLAVDFINQKIYYDDNTRIERRDIDGSNQTIVVNSGINTAFDIELDTINGKIYVAERGSSEISRYNLDGTGVEILLNAGDGLMQPEGLALDIPAGKFYLVDTGSDKVQRADLDGSNLEDLAIGQDNPSGIAIDTAISKIFWIEQGGDRLNKSDLDGSNPQVVFSNGPFGFAEDLALDASAQQVYIIDRGGVGKYFQINYAGTVTNTLQTNLNSVVDLVLLTDTTPPAAPIVTFPANGSTVTSSNVTITGTSEALSFVDLTINMVSLGRLNTDVSGNWSFTQNLGFPEGAHSVVTQATDLAGNQGVVAAASAFTVQTVTPTPTLPDPPVVTTPPGDTGALRPTLTGTTDAGNTVEVFEGMTSLGTAIANGTGVWTLTLTSDLSIGAHTLTVTSTDAMSNTSTATSLALNVEPTLGVATSFYWTGFLDIINVLTALNTSETEDLFVIARLYDAEGAEQGMQAFTVPTSAVLDIVVNDLPGFEQNAFGMVTLEFSGDSFDGQSFYYRTQDGESYEIYSGDTISSSLTGETFVSFNALQPSSAPQESENAVYNWLQIVNEHTSNSQNFTVELLSQTGAILNSESITVPARGRRDLPAGHNLSPLTVGQARITPTDLASPYKASLTRYAADSPLGTTPTGYRFALSLNANAGTSSDSWLPISSGASALNWVTVSNVSSTAAVQLDFYANDGTLLQSLTDVIETDGQRSYNADSLLAGGVSGMLHVQPQGGAFFRSESIFYYSDSSGVVRAVHAAQGRTLAGTKSFASYNQFLNNTEYVRLFNTSNSLVSTSVSVKNALGQSNQSTTVNLSPLTGVEFSLASFPFLLPKNSIGQIKVQTDTPGSVVAELLRVRSQGSAIDGIESIAIR